MKYIVCGDLLFTHYSFDSKKSNNAFDKVEDPVKTFCYDLREHTTQVIQRIMTEIGINLTWK